MRAKPSRSGQRETGRPLAALAFVAALVLSLGWTVAQGSGDSPNTPHPSSTPRPAALTRPKGEVRAAKLEEARAQLARVNDRLRALGSLGPVGFAVADRGGLTLTDAAGENIAFVPEAPMAFNTPTWGHLGPLVVKLVARASGLQLVEGTVPTQEVALKPPRDFLVSQGVRDIIGSWRYALPSPDGDTVLAQWSAECETPIAFWVEPGGPSRPITGEWGRTQSHVPQSIALGWLPTGEAVVRLTEGGCGGPHPAPGVYRYASPGVGELIFRTDQEVAMWTVKQSPSRRN